LEGCDATVNGLDGALLWWEELKRMAAGVGGGEMKEE
jgi:hypothetical protein